MTPSSSFYGNPDDPQEEADIFWLPGPDDLTRSTSDERAESEANSIESNDYDDQQEEFDEIALAKFESADWITTQWERLTGDEKEEIVRRFEELLEQQDESPNPNE